MKYKLETIPVWDAFKEETECPLCYLAEKAEQRYLNYYLGNSVMNPETRVEVNKTGFCPHHFTGLLQVRSNHSLGLLTHTHLEKQIDSFKPDFKSLKNEASRIAGKTVALKSKRTTAAIKKLEDHINKQMNSCMICTRIDYTVKRYTFTIVHLWKTDMEFRDYFNDSNGFCLKHMPDLLKMGEEILSPGKMGEFIQDLIALQEKNNERIEKEILWYTQKFDSQNFDKPWGTSEDAHYRTVQKLSGRSNNTLKK